MIATPANPALKATMNNSAFTASRLTKRYPGHTALQEVNLEIPAGHVVGLIGRNGAGKTTLLQLVAGIILPTTGSCHTLGCPTDRLDSPQLTRLGFVMQEGRFIEWMTVAEHLDFNASFYPTWDRDLQQRITAVLDVPLTRKIADLSTGDRQKVGILLGVCHRPSLLLLDEPMSSLDPIARHHMLELLLERLRDDNCTVVISSHLLEDVEKVVDWIVTLDAGQITENSALDELQESIAEWTVTSTAGGLPGRFTEPYILTQQSRGRVALLTVRTGEPDAAHRFSQTHGVEVMARPLTLGEMFPLLTAPAQSTP